MNLTHFFPGRALEFVDTREYELGRITVPSGRLLIRDPFEPREAGCTLLIPPGNYRTWVTAVDTEADRADRAADYRAAYLSLQLSTAPAIRLDYANAVMQPPVPHLGPLVCVEHGVVALHDADALSDTDIPALADQWSRSLYVDEPHPLGFSNLPLPGEADNIVLSQSGWGDGMFPVLATFDTARRPTAIHVDFGVVAMPESPSAAVPRPGFTAALGRMMRNRGRRARS